MKDSPKGGGEGAGAVRLVANAWAVTRDARVGAQTLYREGVDKSGRNGGGFVLYTDGIGAPLPSTLRSYHYREVQFEPSAYSYNT